MALAGLEQSHVLPVGMHPPAACVPGVWNGISLYSLGRFGQEGWLVPSSSPIIIMHGTTEGYHHGYHRGYQFEGPPSLDLHQDVAQIQHYSGRML